MTAQLKQTEAAFTDALIDFARLRHWLTKHDRPGLTRKGWRTPVQGDGAGWPDLFLVRPPRIVAAELKVGSRRMTEPQVVWLHELSCCKVECFCWTPDDWPVIEDVLR